MRYCIVHPKEIAGSNPSSLSRVSKAIYGQILIFFPLLEAQITGFKPLAINSKLTKVMYLAQRNPLGDVTQWLPARRSGYTALWCSFWLSHYPHCIPGCLPQWKQASNTDFPGALHILPTDITQRAALIGPGFLICKGNFWMCKALSLPNVGIPFPLALPGHIELGKYVGELPAACTASGIYDCEFSK